MAWVSKSSTHESANAAYVYCDRRVDKIKYSFSKVALLTRHMVHMTIFQDSQTHLCLQCLIAKGQELLCFWIE